MTWLKPGGVFLATLGSVHISGWRGEWLGTQMFFSHYDAESVRDAGFAIKQAELVDQDNED